MVHFCERCLAVADYFEYAVTRVQYRHRQNADCPACSDVYRPHPDNGTIIKA